MEPLWTDIQAHAKEWMKEAKEIILASFQSTLHIQEKSGRTDLVTNIDREVEAFFLGKIKSAYPAHHILGEEGTGHDLATLQGIVWIIDPIDGTLNFIHQHRNFAISIGVYQDGIGELGMIYDVMADELYCAIRGQGAYLNGERLKPLEAVSLSDSMISLNASWLLPNHLVEREQAISLVRAVRGTRSIGSAALAITNVVSGIMDAYLSMRLAPWDFAGGLILIREVGAEIADIEGNPIAFPMDSSLIVAKPGLIAQITDIIKKNP
ncbi:MAG: inositol monophosphatase family protein [Bacillus sp. (in: firmicutes)]